MRIFGERPVKHPKTSQKRNSLHAAPAGSAWGQGAGVVYAYFAAGFGCGTLCGGFSQVGTPRILGGPCGLLRGSLRVSGGTAGILRESLPASPNVGEQFDLQSNNPSLQTHCARMTGWERIRMQKNAS